MRSREEIEKSAETVHPELKLYEILEVLLDIRDLLNKINDRVRKG